MLNQVNLCGRTTTDLELKTTPNGVSVTSFTLAVERDYSSGEEKQADFINIVAWRGTAEFASKYFSKGKMMIVSGSLQVRNYTTKNGEKRYITEVVANNVYFAGDKAQNANTGEFTADNDDFTEMPANEDIPF